MRAKLFTDGACLGNPGPMGLGIVLVLPTNELIEKSIPAGIGTNNIAEYTALIKGLELAERKGILYVEAYTDSELLAKQINGKYQVKKEHIKPLHEAINKLRLSFKEFSLEHIPREQNNLADELSKEAAHKQAT